MGGENSTTITGDYWKTTDNQRMAGAGIQGVFPLPVGPDSFDVDDGQSVSNADGHRSASALRQLHHQGPGMASHCELGQQRVAQGKNRRAQLVLAEMLGGGQVAHARERVGQTRHRRRRQAQLLRQLLVAQRRLFWSEAAQQFQAAGQCGGELAIPFVFAKLVWNTAGDAVFRTRSV